MPEPKPKQALMMDVNPLPGDAMEVS